MFNRGKSDFVDGLVTLRATQLHKREQRYSTRSEKEPDDSEKKSTSASKTGTSRSMGIGRTVMPTQNEIVCYACGFQFVMRGRAEVTQCPKCGARLSLKDEKITGGFRDELITAGRVTLARGSLMDGGTIETNDLIVEGMIQGGRIKVHRNLELLAGSSMPEDLMVTRHLRIGPDCSCILKKPFTVENLVVEGLLEGTIVATGNVILRSTGHLKGSLEAQHVSVEEGAGLTAKCRILPPAPPEPPEPPESEEPDTLDEKSS